MIDLVLATGNKHKVQEISAILRGLPVRIIPLSDIPNHPKVVEDGKTLKENAVKKARSIACFSKKWALADDTGLEVAALKGAPGVYSARFAGEGCTYEDNNRKLLGLLAGLPRSRRRAAFRCVIAISDPRGRTRTADGSIAGVIDDRLKGSRGFGYDPLFYVPSKKKTFAQLSAGVKNRISHRARALRKAKQLIRTLVK